MSDPQTPEGDAASRPGFDPARFFEIARKVGHGRALGLEYRDSGDGWYRTAKYFTHCHAPTFTRSPNPNRLSNTKC